MCISLHFGHIPHYPLLPTPACGAPSSPSQFSLAFIFFCTLLAQHEVGCFSSSPMATLLKDVTFPSPPTRTTCSSSGRSPGPQHREGKHRPKHPVCLGTRHRSPCRNVSRRQCLTEFLPSSTLTFFPPLFCDVL